MWSQTKVLQKLLKQQRKELKEKGDMENITGWHKNFMQLIKSLDDCMRDIAGEPKPQATVQQPEPQPTTSKAMSHADLKPIYEVKHGKARYWCPLCKHTKMSKGVIYTHLCNVHDMVPFVCLICGFSTTNHTSLKNHELHHKMKDSNK